METHKKTVLITVFIAVVFLGFAILCQRGRLPRPIALNTTGEPTVGSGAIEIVVFEDLTCINCKIFTKEIVPQISSSYIETGEARFTVIPVAFGNDSKPLANAAIGVYRINSDRFIAFLFALLHISGNDREHILQVAQNVGGIDLEALGLCIDQKLYDPEIDHNLVWAKRLMGEDFGTPTLLINGIETSTDSFAKIQERIQQIRKVNERL